jgi:hypothetical protein
VSWCHHGRSVAGEHRYLYDSRLIATRQTSVSMLLLLLLRYRITAASTILNENFSCSITVVRGTQRLAQEAAPTSLLRYLRLRSLWPMLFCDVICLSSFPPFPPISSLRHRPPTSRGKSQQGGSAGIVMWFGAPQTVYRPIIRIESIHSRIDSD